MAVRFPLGKDLFTKVRESNDYYVDKTGIIEELLDESVEVRLITRPRRFGKTLMLSMLEDFFDIRRDSSAHFEGLKVSENKELCSNWMNQWPVIFLSLKSVNGNSFESAYEMFQVLIADLYAKYTFLKDSGSVDVVDKETFDKLRSAKGEAADVKSSLYLLSRML